MHRFHSCHTTCILYTALSCITIKQSTGKCIQLKAAFNWVLADKWNFHNARVLERIIQRAYVRTYLHAWEARRKALSQNQNCTTKKGSLARTVSMQFPAAFVSIPEFSMKTSLFPGNPNPSRLRNLQLRSVCLSVDLISLAQGLNFCCSDVFCSSLQLEFIFHSIQHQTYFNNQCINTRNSKNAMLGVLKNDGDWIVSFLQLIFILWLN